MIGAQFSPQQVATDGGIYSVEHDAWTRVDPTLAPSGFFPIHAVWDGCHVLLAGMCDYNGYRAELWAYEPPT